AARRSRFARVAGATLPDRDERQGEGEDRPATPSGQRPAFWILPDLMHEVQTWSRFVVPLTLARTRWMLGFHRRLVRTCECETDMPNDALFSHTSPPTAMNI